MVSHGSSKKTKSRTSAKSSTKPSPRQTGSSPASSADHDIKSQQKLLNIFSSAFANVLSSERFPTLLQDIKQALYNRAFDLAFGNEDRLEAYAARWSPTRALCYASIFSDLRKHANHSRMLSIGGCAAEYVAFASDLQQTQGSGSLTLLDSGPWKQVLSLLERRMTTSPPISTYASEAAKAANTPFLGQSQLSVAFNQLNVLELDREQLLGVVGSRPLAVTLMFTLNELYTQGGIGKTTRFLRDLGSVLPHGSLLLVTDSPGSYSEAAIGKDKKKYPMQWLLHHTLTEGERMDFEWEQLESHDSVWFRLSEELSYPAQLENMRYQMHLYRIRSIDARSSIIRKMDSD